MPAAAMPRQSRFLDADEVRAILNRKDDSGDKDAFLDALVGSMTEEEAAEFEKRVNEFAECVDEGDVVRP